MVQKIELNHRTKSGNDFRELSRAAWCCVNPKPDRFEEYRSDNNSLVMK